MGGRVVCMRYLALFLLLLATASNILVVYPQPTPTQDIPYQQFITALEQNWRMIAFLIIVVAISIAALGYMVGSAINDPKIKAMAGVEIRQAIANLLIIAFLFMVIDFVNGLFDNLTIRILRDGIPEVITCNQLRTQLSARYAERGIQNPSCLVSFGLFYLDYFREQSIGVGRVYLHNAMEFSKRASYSTGRYGVLFYLLFGGIREQPEAGLTILARRYDLLYAELLNALSFIESQKNLLILSVTKLGMLLIILGIIFRSFYMTRRAGGLLLAIGLNIMLLLPALYLFAWILWANTVLPTEVNPERSTCPAECFLSPPVAYSVRGTTLTLFYISLLNSTPISYQNLYERITNVRAVSIADVRIGDNNVDLLNALGQVVESIPRNQITNCLNLSNEMPGEKNLGLQNVDLRCLNECPTICRYMPYPFQLPECQRYEEQCRSCNRYCYVYRVPTPINTSNIPSSQLSIQLPKYTDGSNSNRVGFQYCDSNCPTTKCPEICRLRLPVAYFRDDRDINIYLVSSNPRHYDVTGAQRMQNSCTSPTEVFEQGNNQQSTCPLACRITTVPGVKNPPNRPEQIVASCERCTESVCPDTYRYTLPEASESCADPKFADCPYNCRYRINDQFISTECRDRCERLNLPDGCYVHLTYYSQGSNSCNIVPKNCLINKNLQLNYVIDSNSYTIGFSDVMRYSLGILPTTTDEIYNIGESTESQGTREVLIRFSTYSEIGQNASQYGIYSLPQFMPPDALFGCENSFNYTNNYRLCNNLPYTFSHSNSGPCGPYMGPLYVNSSSNYHSLISYLNEQTGIPENELMIASPQNTTTWVMVIRALMNSAHQNELANIAVRNCSQCPMICRYIGLGPQNTSVCLEGEIVLCSDEYCPQQCKLNLDDYTGPLAGGCLGCNRPECLSGSNAPEDCPEICNGFVDLPGTSIKAFFYCPAVVVDPGALEDECAQCYSSCDPACITMPPLRNNCEELCSDSQLSMRIGNPYEMMANLMGNSVGIGPRHLPIDVLALVVIYVPAYVLPLLNIVVLIASIRTLSVFLGGEIEIPGLVKLL